MKIIVGVTGGIAAYKSVTIVRQLVTAGHDVTVIPTESALRFVGTPTWEAASRHPVTTSVHDDVARVRHVALGQKAELIIIAPTTANFIAKVAAGLADDLLGTTLLATKAPVVLAPAMHTEMWLHPSTVDNVATLRRRGVHIVGPESGALTGGDDGPGRMTEPADIVAFALRLLAPDTTETSDDPGTRTQDLDGLRVVVSAGGTREPIDPVRFLGNRSSGRQGVAVAAAAAARGADVTLVAANVSADVLTALSVAASAANAAPAAPSRPVRVRAVGTAAELAAEVNTLEDEADVIVMAAAVADYRPVTVSDGKLTKDVVGDRLTIELVANPDILAGLVAARRVGQMIVGFAAETSSSHEELLERGRRKRARKGVDILALNAVGWDAGFETLDNTLVIIGSDDAVIAESSGSKRVVADALWDAVLTTRI